MRDAGVDAVALEVSSHALALHRVDGLRFAVATLTNLSADHLDFHGDVDAYFAAKRTLFESDRAASAAVNIDDPYGRALWRSLRIEGLSFGLDGDADVKALDVDLRPDGTAFRLRAREGETSVHTRLPGEHNLRNCLAAAATALLVGVDLGSIAAGIARVDGVPGRLEVVDEGQPFRVLVDFARTPVALDAALRAARLAAAPEGRVRCVFGCWGESEKARRRDMGAVAARGADDVVLTFDDPRDEDPLAIVDEIDAGARAAVRDCRPRSILDRREAIATVIGEANDGDVVLIAGRGSEIYHTILGRSIVLDDRDVAREALRARTLRGASP
jgi:UDP-N-acetylmuramoyl-L-alanyl-D-glutamate--2,6-diaminopimelate ligase